MDIHVNGEPKSVDERCSVADLVARLGLQPKFVAVERNEQLVPRSEHAGCRLEPGDRIEIVTLVGGG